ncbi:MAG: hypothetical protein U9N56_04555 [Actinomycetota bacterium]|nr:hypothetical protein [Actinomycetota bacterium]
MQPGRRGCNVDDGGTDEHEFVAIDDGAFADDHRGASDDYHLGDVHHIHRRDDNHS